MAQVKVDYAWSVAIRVRYLGPTDHRGSRFRVFRSDGTYNDDPDRLTVDFDYSLSQSERAVDCVRRYLEHKRDRFAQMGKDYFDSWIGPWTVASANDREYIAVKAAAPMGEED